MKTAIEERYVQERLLAIADVLRLLLVGPSDVMSPAINRIVNKYPRAAQYIPLGSRPGETRPKPEPSTEYREGCVYYWRPGNVGSADSYKIFSQGDE